MKTTIDRAGRVVIPAIIRQRAGLKAGTELEVLVEEEERASGAAGEAT
jgi:AbrB family looped-hinge helix DNA binding protein